MKNAILVRCAYAMCIEDTIRQPARAGKLIEGRCFHEDNIR